MTGYTVHTGSSKKYSEGWDQIFSKESGKKTKKGAKNQKKSTAKKGSKKKK